MGGWRSWHRKTQRWDGENSAGRGVSSVCLRHWQTMEQRHSLGQVTDIGCASRKPPKRGGNHTDSPALIPGGAESGKSHPESRELRGSPFKGGGSVFPHPPPPGSGTTVLYRTQGISTNLPAPLPSTPGSPAPCVHLEHSVRIPAHGCQRSLSPNTRAHLPPPGQAAETRLLPGAGGITSQESGIHGPPAACCPLEVSAAP